MSSKRTLWRILAAVSLATPALIACSSDDDSGTAAPVASDSASDDAGSTADGTTVTPNGPTLVDAGVRETGVGLGTVDASKTADDAGTFGDAAVTDAAVADATLDAAVDAAADAPVGVPSDAGVDDAYAPPGSACATDQDVQHRLCGFCGKSSRICLATSPDGGATWQPWGDCLGETQAATRCAPGDARNVPCGMCGSQPQTCQNDCSWAVGFCDQPTTSVCKPDASDYEPGLSCAVGGRIRYCQNNCTYGNFSDCFDPSASDAGAGSGIAIPRTVGTAGKITLSRTLAATPKIPRFDLSDDICPQASLEPGTNESYDYIVVKNTDSARKATISVWTLASAANNAPSLETMMTVYVGRTTPPVTEAERANCSIGINFGCIDTDIGDTTACVDLWGALVDNSQNGGSDDRPTLAPGQSAVIFVGGFDDVDHGDYRISIRTDILQ